MQTPPSKPPKVIKKLETLEEIYNTIPDALKEPYIFSLILNGKFKSPLDQQH